MRRLGAVAVLLSLPLLYVIVIRPHLQRERVPGRAEEAGPDRGAVERDRGLGRLGNRRFRHLGGVLYVRYSADGESIITGGEDGRIRVWNAASGEERFRVDAGPASGHLCFASDGRIVAGGAIAWRFGERGGDLAWWDVATGEEIRRLTLDGMWAHAMAFSPEGGALYVSTRSHHSGAFEKWDTRTGAREEGFDPEGFPVGPFAVSPQGGRIVGSTRGGVPRIWDARTGKAITDLTVPEMSILANALAFSGDGSRVACGEVDGTVRIFEAATGRPGSPLPLGLDSAIVSLAFSPSSEVLAIAESDGDLHLVNARDGRPARGFAGRKDPPRIDAFRQNHGSLLDFAPGGARLASAAVGCGIGIWDVATGEEVSGRVGHGAFVTSLEFSPDGASLISGAGDGDIRLWAVEAPSVGRTLSPQGDSVRTLSLHGGPVRSLSLSADGKVLASAGEDGTVILHDLAAGKEMRRWTVDPAAGGGRERPGPGGRLPGLNLRSPVLQSIAMRPAGDRVLAGTSLARSVFLDREGERQLKATEASPGHEADRWHAVVQAQTNPPPMISLRCIRWREAWMESADVSADGGTWVVRESYRGVRVISEGEPTIAWTIDVTGHPLDLPRDELLPGVAALALYPTADRLVVGDTSGTIRIVETASGATVRNWKAHPFIVSSVDVSRDGVLIASAGPDRTLRIWNGMTGKPVLALEGPEGGTLAVRFSPDGDRLASGGLDGTIELWDLEGVARPPEPAEPLSSPDGLAEAWTTLSGSDAAAAYDALVVLFAAPDEALPFLSEKLLHPCKEMEGPVVFPIKESGNDTLRRLRACHVLECLADRQAAREILEKMAGSGEGCSPVTRFARQAVARTSGRGVESPE